MFDLVDRLPELLVEHSPVGDHHHRIEDQAVFLVVEAHEPVRQPGDAVRLAASRRVLDQVVVPRPAAPRFLGEPPHGVELVVTRKDQGFPGAPLPSASPPGAPAPRPVPVPFLEEQETPQDVEETVAGERPFPEVRRPVSVRIRRIPCPAAGLAGQTPPVERQELRLLPHEPGGDAHFVRVRGEVRERPFREAEERRRGIAILPVLARGVAPTLPGGGILEFDGGHRQAVQRQDQVHGRAFPRMTGNLARHRQLVSFVERRRLLVQAVRRTEPGEPQRLPVEAEPVAEDFERALRRQLGEQRLHQPRGKRVRADLRFEFRPGPRLTGP